MKKKLKKIWDTLNEVEQEIVIYKAYKTAKELSDLKKQ